MRDDAVLGVAGLRLSIRSEEGTARVLDHLALRLERGRVLGVVGESGCGKSTLARAIMGILPAGARVEAGRIRFEGEDLLTLGEAAMNRRIRGSRIGFIPQDPTLALNPLFRVGTQIMEIMRVHAQPEGPPRRWRAEFTARLVALLRRVQLPDPEAALQRYPHEFSGGQRQRLLIAAALACAPGLVVADEPTTALDVTTQQQILDLLRELVRELGVSLLFVTHDLGVVAQLCDEVSVIYAGQTVENGPTEAVLAAPSHPYTRALLACHPERSQSFTGIPGSVPSPLRPPPGCRFAPRCTESRPACAARLPHLVATAGGPLVDCLLHEPPSAASVGR